MICGKPARATSALASGMRSKMLLRKSPFPVLLAWAVHLISSDSQNGQRLFQGRC